MNVIFIIGLVVLIIIYVAANFQNDQLDFILYDLGYSQFMDEISNRYGKITTNTLMILFLLAVLFIGMLPSWLVYWLTKSEFHKYISKCRDDGQGFWEFYLDFQKYR
jgi:hypothetical protein